MPALNNQSVITATQGNNVGILHQPAIKESHNAITTCRDFENRWKRDLKIAIERCITIKHIQDLTHYGFTENTEVSVNNLLDDLHTKTAILMASPLINSNVFLETFPIDKFTSSNSLNLGDDSDSSHLFDGQHSNVFIARLIKILGFYNGKNDSVGEPVKDQDIGDELTLEEDEEYDDSDEVYLDEEDDIPEPLNENEYNNLLTSIVIKSKNNDNDNDNNDNNDNNYNKIMTICSNVCYICLDSYNPGDCIKQTVCDHYFHDECIKPWFNNSVFCPACRTNQRSPSEHN